MKINKDYYCEEHEYQRLELFFLHIGILFNSNMVEKYIFDWYDNNDPSFSRNSFLLMP